VTEIKTQHKHVNSKLLIKDLDEFIVDGLSTLTAFWDDETYQYHFIEAIKQCLYELEENKKIYNFKIVTRQEKIKQDNGQKKSVNVLRIYFRQSHCLNVTSLKYIFPT